MVRDRSIRFVVTDRELAEIQMLAEQERRSVSDLIRTAIRERREALQLAPVPGVRRLA